MMDRALTGFFRVGAWLTSASSILIAVILLIDVLLHWQRLGAQFLAVSVVVGLLFAAVGVAVFCLQRNLGRIYRHPIGGGDRTAVAELTRPWLVVHLALGALLALASVLMMGTSIAMISRLGQGFTIFG